MTDQMNVAAELLRAEFDHGEVLQFQGRGGKTFDYIEDETVMDRLDEVLGIGASSFDFDVISDQCVRGRLIVTWPNGDTSHYQDFGYATRADSAEPLKEAVSDAIRRLGRYVGVARYLYRKHEVTPARPAPRQPVQDAPRRPVAPESTHRPVAVESVPEEPDYLRLDSSPPFAPIAGLPDPGLSDDSEMCPIHQTKWGGTPGDLFHGPKGVTQNGYCRHPGNVKKARRTA